MYIWITNQLQTIETHVQENQYEQTHGMADVGLVHYYYVGRSLYIKFQSFSTVR